MVISFIDSPSFCTWRKDSLWQGWPTVLGLHTRHVPKVFWNLSGVILYFDGNFFRRSSIGRSTPEVPSLLVYLFTMVWLFVAHFSQLPLANQKCIDFSVLIVRNIRDFACFHLFLVEIVKLLQLISHQILSAELDLGYFSVLNIP